jgi:hypothetical protein
MPETGISHGIDINTAKLRKLRRCLFLGKDMISRRLAVSS